MSQGLVAPIRTLLLASGRTVMAEHTNKVYDLHLVSVISKSRKVRVCRRSHHVVDKWDMTRYVLSNIHVRISNANEKRISIEEMVVFIFGSVFVINSIAFLISVFVFIMFMSVFVNCF